MWLDNPIHKEFQRLSDRFFSSVDDFETNWFGDSFQTTSPYFYGYTLTVSPEGKPIVKEYGNSPLGVTSSSGAKTPYVDEVIDQENKTVKLVAELPGVEKSDINVSVEDKYTTIMAENKNRKYKTQVPIKHKIDPNSANAKYTNGVLEVTFKLAEDKPKGKLIPVL